MTAMQSVVRSIVNTGSGGTIIDIECHVSNSLPSIVIVGSVARAVDEAKERLRGAFSNSQLQLPRKRITINLAPADIPKDESGFDLGIATAIILANNPTLVAPAHSIFIGELGLDGSVRPVRGIIGKLMAGRKHGIETFFIPQGNLEQSQLVPDIALVPVKNLRDLHEHLTGALKLPTILTGVGKSPEVISITTNPIGLSDIVGQAFAKRALEIAAAGGHNIFFHGPPGTGKSMLAQALPSMMPPLSHEEMLEVTHMHSLANHTYDQVVTTRPFRSPHHSASHVAVIGGGHNLRPGEISLSHRGILFFDELPEFSRMTLEALRQPLENRTITVARAKDSVDYPANFILVATANPCPCGYFGTSKPCKCQAHQIQRYQQKLSGPIMDRIDLYANVSDVDHASLITHQASPEEDKQVLDRITAARNLQKARFSIPGCLNSDMSNRDVKRYAFLSPAAKELLDTAATKLDISARSYMRTVKISRTIADLNDSATIEPQHITEALQFRQPTRQI